MCPSFNFGCSENDFKYAPLEYMRNEANIFIVLHYLTTQFCTSLNISSDFFLCVGGQAIIFKHFKYCNEATSNVFHKFEFWVFILMNCCNAKLK